jgi:preprotein translocase subunit SecE
MVIEQAIVNLIIVFIPVIIMGIAILVVDSLGKWPYNRHIATKEHTMTDTQIIVTVLVVAVVFAVKVWILTKI